MQKRTSTRLTAACLLATLVSFALAGSLQAGYNEWTPLGPYGGYVYSLAVSPDYTTDYTVYAATFRGLFFTSDGGASWSRLAGEQNLPRIESISISPGFANDKTMFCCSNIYDLMFKSVDGGVSWSELDASGLAMGVKVVQVSPSYPSDQTVFVGMFSGGILRSPDGGSSWSQSNIPLSEIGSISFSPAFSSDQTVFAGGLGGIYKSTDGGDTWFSSYSGITNSWIKDISLSPSYPSDQTAFAASYYGKFYRSTDGGASWSEVYADPNNNCYLSRVEVSPSFDADGTVFVITSSQTPEAAILRSTDGGENWSLVHEIFDYFTEGDIVISPGYSSDVTVFVGTGSDVNGVLKTVDGGDTWSVAIDGMTGRGTNSMTASPDPAEPGTLFELNNTHIHKSTDGGANWSVAFKAVSSDYFRWIEMSPTYTADQTAFVVTDRNLYKTTDGGQNWSYANITVPSSGQIRSIAISSSYSSDQTAFVLLASGLNKTTDGGATWNPSGSGIPDNNISAIAISPDYSSDQTAFLIRNYNNNAEIYKTTDGGANWSLIFTGTSYPSITILRISPAYATDQTVYASTYGSTSGGGVLKTTDGGSSWTQFNTGLNSLQIKNLAISPDYSNDQTLYLRDNSGTIWKTVNGGSTWHVKTSAMVSPSDVRRICISADYANDKTIYAASGIRGVLALTDAQTYNPELTHYYWSEWLAGGCVRCHPTPQTFLQSGFNEPNAHCYTCHNSAAPAHGLVLTQKGHGVMASITSVGITQPTYGSGPDGESDNRPYANLLGDKVGCITCHNVMQKPEDTGRAWEMTTTSDNITYTLQNGGWESYGYYVPRVYRDSSLWSEPTYVKDKKAYLVGPSEYGYDESSGTVTFHQVQDPADYIYVTLYYPSLRASSEGNRLCSDCHGQATHQGVNCLVCHAAHNSDNISFIRDEIRLPNRSSSSVVFINTTGQYSFADGDTTYDGICEVCHTTTKYHRRDGSGFANHSSGVNQAGSDCTACHTHASGFAK